MTTKQQLIVYPDHDSLATATGERVIDGILAAQRERGFAHVCLTGGRGGTSALAAVLASSRCQDIDWANVDFWWSDERFLNEGDPERNETGAREALLDHIDVPDDRIHPMPRLDGALGDDVDAAAVAYSSELLAAGAGELLVFDICMLGIGEDAHVASLFPGRDEQFENEPVVSVQDSPKPPPTRTTFTMPTILSSREVWLVASGAGKADAIALALSGASAKQAPAGAARGLEATLVLADEDAASRVPH